MRTVTLMDEQTVMEKQRNRRTRTILVIGIAFVAVGLLFCLATQITTLHHYTQYCPDGNGGVIPIQRSDAPPTVGDEPHSVPSTPELGTEREKTSEMKYCSYCGQQTAADSSFCEKCGKRVK